MKRIIVLLTFLTFVFTSALTFTPTPVYADGIIIPEPPICDPGGCPEPFPISQLAIEYHHVDVTANRLRGGHHIERRGLEFRVVVLGNNENAHIC